jgi:hypothetical protein
VLDADEVEDGQREGRVTSGQEPGRAPRHSGPRPAPRVAGRRASYATLEASDSTTAVTDPRSTPEPHRARERRRPGLGRVQQGRRRHPEELPAGRVRHRRQGRREDHDPGFLSFEQVDRAAREGRNPSTGETIQIAASKAVKVTAGSALKNAAAGK